MRVEQIAESLQLESGRHYHKKSLPTVVIDSALYTSLGKRLFEIYEKYKIAKTDQRELEQLIYILTSFTIARAKDAEASLLKRWVNKLWKR